MRSMADVPLIDLVSAAGHGGAEPGEESPADQGGARPVGSEPGPVRGRHAAVRAPFSWSPAPGRARPGCSLTGSRTSSGSSASRRSRSWRSRSPTRPRARCASGSRELVGPVARRMWVSTFHAACSRILRREATLLGYRSSFTIYDQADAVRLTDWIRRDLNLDPKRFPARQIHAPDQRAEERAHPAAPVLGDGRRARRAASLRDLHRVPASPARSVSSRLRRSPRARRAFVPRAPRSARAIPEAIQTRARRRVPGHQRRAVGARPPAHPRAPQRDGRG